MDHVDCVVVGAGVVGLAIARAFARAGVQVLILEAAAASGHGTSGRGSGVIHAGLYYPTDSLKARLCVAGRDMLYRFAEAYGVPVRRLGKLVVATSAEEDETLDAIASQASLNGVADIERLDGSQARRLEPALVCTSALLSPSTGVIEAAALMHALRDDAEDFGAVSAVQAPVEAVHRTTVGFVLAVGGAAPMRLSCRLLINAAGHGAPALARTIEGLPAAHIPRSFYAKGHYFATTDAPPFSRLIYPVPVPGGVGTHLTLDPAGAARFGPDVEWVEALDYSVDPARAERFSVDIRRWWPGLADSRLHPAGAGIRPKITGPGEPSGDFLIEGQAAHGIAGLVNLFGIESPGLTASLAIGDHVFGMMDC